MRRRVQACAAYHSWLTTLGYTASNTLSGSEDSAAEAAIRLEVRDSDEFVESWQGVLALELDDEQVDAVLNN